MTTPIHDELHRVVLRTRWVRWVDRQLRDRPWQAGQVDVRAAHFVKLSDRLTKWRPTWEERQFDEKDTKASHDNC